MAEEPWTPGISGATYRYRCFELTPEMVLELIHMASGTGPWEGRQLRISGCPVTARAIRAGITADDNIRLIVEDPSFDLIRGGMIVPRGILTAHIVQKGEIT